MTRYDRAFPASYHIDPGADREINRLCRRLADMRQSRDMWLRLALIGWFVALVYVAHILLK